MKAIRAIFDRLLRRITHPRFEEQAKGPFLNPVEMANPNKRAVVEKVRRAADADRFEAVFGKGALDRDSSPLRTTGASRTRRA